jgi:hypothetical protein
MTTWPGANFVALPDGNRWFLKYGDRRKMAAELKVPLALLPSDVSIACLLLCPSSTF